MMKGDRVRAILFGARPCDFKVSDTVPDEIVLIHPLTAIRMEVKDGKEKQGLKISYEDIGGLSKQVQRIRR